MEDQINILELIHHYLNEKGYRVSYIKACLGFQVDYLHLIINQISIIVEINNSILSISIGSNNYDFDLTDPNIKPIEEIIEIVNKECQTNQS